MDFGTKIKLKKEWKIAEHLTAEKGEIFDVVFYTVKYGMQLRHRQVSDLINFWYDYTNREERVNDYFEVITNETIVDEALERRLKTIKAEDFIKWHDELKKRFVKYQIKKL